MAASTEIPQCNSDPEILRARNGAFQDFLHITETDQQLVRRYRDALSADAERFAKQFYDYLLGFEPTARVLHDYEAEGGRLEDLVERQRKHLYNLLEAELGDEAAADLCRIGRLHFQRGVEPSWVMGAYRLYLDYLQNEIGTAIDPPDRATVNTSLTKILLRDMGLMLEGYWQSAMVQLANEQERAAALQSQITNLLTNLPQILWSVDVVRDELLYMSPAADTICPARAADPRIPCLGWTIDEDRAEVLASWDKALAGEVTEVESRIVDDQGGHRWFRRSFHPVTDDAGSVIRIDGLMEDVTARKETLSRLERLATRDLLTGLGNRALWNQVVTSTLHALSGTGKGAAIMLLDLNHFKVVNDTLGHTAGDELLIQAAGRLKDTLRETDTVVRLGGDEFAVLLPFQERPLESAPPVAEKISQAFGEPFQVAGDEISLSCAIGIVCYPEQGEDLETLMSRADIAMYRAKRRHEPYHFFELENDQPEHESGTVLTGLRRGLREGQFEVHYQPIVNLHTGRPTSVEALVRWRKEPGQLILPEAFIPIASQTGVIHELTHVVLEQSLRTVSQWRNRGHELPVAVNIPPLSFHSRELIPTIEQVLADTGLTGDALWLEITEEHLIAQTDHVRSVCQDLAARGIRIAIDDFGTGYSSLAYLKRLPLHGIKVDRSFITEIQTDENDRVVTRTIIQMGQNLGLDVVAEGVENSEALAMLNRWACPRAQGFHIAEPQSAAQFLHWLDGQLPPAMQPKGNAIDGGSGPPSSV